MWQMCAVRWRFLSRKRITSVSCLPISQRSPSKVLLKETVKAALTVESRFFPHPCDGVIRGPEELQGIIQADMVQILAEIHLQTVRENVGKIILADMKFPGQLL